MVRRCQESVDGTERELGLLQKIRLLKIILSLFPLNSHPIYYTCLIKPISAPQKESTFPLRSTYHSRFLRHKQKYQKRS